LVFKQFNFDSHVKPVIECIDKHFQTTFGSEFVLEIDYEVMPQIVSASWLSDNKKSVEDWMNIFFEVALLRHKRSTTMELNMS